MKGIYQFAANLLSYIPAKYYWNRSTYDLVIAKSRMVNFFWNTVYSHLSILASARRYAQRKIRHTYKSFAWIIVPTVLRISQYMIKCLLDVFDSGSLHFLDSLSLSSNTTCTHKPQGVNYRGYLHVLKYLLLLYLTRKGWRRRIFLQTSNRYSFAKVSR